MPNRTKKESDFIRIGNNFINCDVDNFVTLRCVIGNRNLLLFNRPNPQEMNGKAIGNSLYSWNVELPDFTNFTLKP